MGRLLVVGLLVGTLLFLHNRLNTNPLSPTVHEREVVVETDRLEVRFYRADSVAGSYMVFGGNEAEKSGFFSNVLISTLAQRHAALISQRHPDFHMCRSPGAAQAQRLIENMGLIGADGSVRRTLLKAVSVHKERLGKGGERTCMSLDGERLALASVHSKPQGIDVTELVEKGSDVVDFYLVNEAALVDCKALLQ